jgi:fructose-1,6-bisphosphatase II
MLLNGVSRNGRYIRTESMILRSESGTIRRVTADYLAERWD